MNFPTPAPAPKPKELKKEERFSAINRCLDQSFVNTVKRKSSVRKAKILHFIFAKSIFKIRDRAKFLAKEEDRRRRLSATPGNDFTYIDNCTAPYELFTERALYQFEDRQFYGPKDYDKVLTLHYGDYMKIPKGDQQRQHNFHILDLEHPYREYNGEA